MSHLPDTRQSLLRRASDLHDDAAWSEFVTIYRPAVLRFALRRGLQLADAEDVTQRVFVVVARKLKEWNPDAAAGSFRAWLLTVTRNAVINAVTRQPRDTARGGTSTLQRLGRQPSKRPDRSLEDELERECQRAEFRRAATEVEHEFEPATWQAFWLTAVNQQEVAAVASKLGKSNGSVYAARSRVMRRIRQRVLSIRPEREDASQRKAGH